MEKVRICAETDTVCVFQDICTGSYCVRESSYYQKPEPPCGGKTAAELGPVRTVTRKEIVEGYYGPKELLYVFGALESDRVRIAIDCNTYTAAELREFARLLTEIADAMEEKP